MDELKESTSSPAPAKKQTEWTQIVVFSIIILVFSMLLGNLVYDAANRCHTDSTDDQAFKVSTFMPMRNPPTDALLADGVNITKVSVEKFSQLKLDYPTTTKIGCKVAEETFVLAQMEIGATTAMAGATCVFRAPTKSSSIEEKVNFFYEGKNFKHDGLTVGPDTFYKWDDLCDAEENPLLVCAFNACVAEFQRVINLTTPTVKNRDDLLKMNLSQ